MKMSLLTELCDTKAETKAYKDLEPAFYGMRLTRHPNILPKTVYENVIAPILMAAVNSP
jgi:hypothetical protein